MNCEEVREQLPAYAIGALEPDEVVAVEAHLAGCRLHDEELVELRATVFAMDRYREELTPAPSLALAGRIQQVTDSDSGARPAASGAPARATMPAGWRLFAGIAAALALFGAGWLASGALTGADDVYAVVLQDGDGARMEVSGPTSGDSVTVVMDGLARLPEGSSYQVWAIRDDGWVSIGTCNTNAEGWWHGDFDFQIEEGENVALTIEPRGGSPAPSSEPLLRSAP